VHRLEKVVAKLEADRDYRNQQILELNSKVQELL
jgi:hypothetical protein